MSRATLRGCFMDFQELEGTVNYLNKIALTLIFAGWLMCHVPANPTRVCAEMKLSHFCPLDRTTWLSELVGQRLFYIYESISPLTPNIENRENN